MTSWGTPQARQASSKVWRKPWNGTFGRFTPTEPRKCTKCFENVDD